MQTKSIPYVLLLGLMFGSSLLVSRFSLSQFEASTYVSARMLIASILFSFVSLLNPQFRWPKDKTLWKQAAVLGVFGTAIPISFINLSMMYQSGGMTALLLTLGPAITVLMAGVFLEDEPLNFQKLLGITVALSGAVLLMVRGENGLPGFEETNSMGYLFVFLAMAASSFSIVYTRKKMRTRQAIEITGIRLFIAALTVAPISYLLKPFDFSTVQIAGYLGLAYATVVGTLLAMLLSFYIVKNFGATASAISSYVVTVVGSLGGVLLLGEAFTQGMFWGTLLIVGGIFMLGRARRKPAMIENPPL